MRVASLRVAAAAAALAGLSLAASPSYAVDGVVLIDQTMVPLTITDPGSYRLSSNVAVTGPATAISIQSNDVSLDLNGFTVSGDATPFSDGIFVYATNVEIRNGTVRGFGRHGIFAVNLCFKCTDAEGLRILEVRSVGNGFDGFAIETQGALVDKCSALGNGGLGFYMGVGSLVTNSVARVNGSFGFAAMGPSAGYRSNVFTVNNGTGLNVSGGTNLGANLCGNALCP